MESVSKEKIRTLKLMIWAVSIAVVGAVAVLLGVKIDGYDTSFLPATYATINGLTAIVLLGAIAAIKKGNRKRHENLIKVALVLSVLFLLGYVARHMTSDPTPYGNKESILYWVYMFVLITHVILSMVVIPLVLFTYLRAYIGDFEGHKKLAKVSFPIWLYVAVSGVVVYLMIQPYY